MFEAVARRGRQGTQAALPGSTRISWSSLLKRYVVRSKPLRAPLEGSFGLRQNLVRAAARSTAGESLRAQASGGNLEFHEPTRRIEPEVHGFGGAAAHRDVAEPGGGMIYGGRGQSVILDFHRLPAQGTPQDRRCLHRFPRRHPSGAE